ncbi:C-terminal binding protein [Mesorhizobium sp. BAC0120]|uniref:C-terminal binding protein n=1 Tax=Mesorhizobium sp. BAC0120 TaxID=3090670 RepID=UPI00298CA59F|nr:C-terminal binding protein [Mesorhizobium sp. BAC0120]MDW6024002.1 C-terminal binding protein [Mesorhizobium sp. BAC0120]
MRILKVNTYAPDTALYQAFGPDVVFDIHRDPSEPPSLDRCRAADAVINCSATLPIGVGAEHFERCRIAVREGVGYDTMDLAGWGARGVPVCNVPDYGTTEVADHALALLLALTRGTSSYQEAVRDRSDGWRYDAAPLVRRLRGQTFAVLGLGRIGLAAARRAAAFDMKVIFYDPYLPNGAELAAGYERVRRIEEVMARADILSIHTPLNDETRGMVGVDLLAKAKPGLIVINTARGPIVDLDALGEALKTARIAGAGLDVLPKEPADSDHPLIKAYRQREAWTEGRLMLSPHSAFYSPSALEDMQRKAIEVIVSYLREGVLMNCVNAEHMKRAPRAA